METVNFNFAYVSNQGLKASIELIESILFRVRRHQWPWMEGGLRHIQLICIVELFLRHVGMLWKSRHNAYTYIQTFLGPTHPRSHCAHHTNFNYKFRVFLVGLLRIQGARQMYKFTQTIDIAHREVNVLILINF